MLGRVPTLQKTLETVNKPKQTTINYQQQPCKTDMLPLSGQPPPHLGPNVERPHPPPDLSGGERMTVSLSKETEFF